VLARLACDSPVRRLLLDPNGAILHHGDAHRFATSHQKRALAVRDRGCVVPGCHAPPEWCDAHHVTPWSKGGPTDLDGMALLCGHHHSAVHAGVYQVQMRDGLPWIRLPGWQDPTRPWVRPPDEHHEADRIARHLAVQPRLPLDDHVDCVA